MDESRNAQHAERRGYFNAEKFTLDTGWDLAKESQRSAFWKKLKQFAPGEM